MQEHGCGVVPVVEARTGMPHDGGAPLLARTLVYAAKQVNFFFLPVIDRPKLQVPPRNLQGGRNTGASALSTSH